MFRMFRLFMRRAIPLTLAAALSVSLLPQASAAPSVAEIQRQVNDLREEAASKYEAANEIGRAHV